MEQTTARHRAVDAVAMHRKAGFASNIVSVIKNEFSSLIIDAPPCLSEESVRFWLQHKFNASDELLHMRSLSLIHI